MKSLKSSGMCQDISTWVCQGTKHTLWNGTVTLNLWHPKELRDPINSASSLSSQWLCGLLGRWSGCYKARLMDPVRLVPGNENNHWFAKINLKSRAKAKFPFLSPSLCGPLCGSQWFDGVGQAVSSPRGAKQWQKSTSPGNKTSEVVNVSFMFHVQKIFLGIWVFSLWLLLLRKPGSKACSLPDYRWPTGQTASSRQLAIFSQVKWNNSN